MEAKKLTRSVSDKKIMGVCGGIAKYYNLDSNLVRIIAAMFALTGAGMLTYFIAAFILPESE